jgi:hypothetical protein
LIDLIECGLLARSFPQKEKLLITLRKVLLNTYLSDLRILERKKFSCMWPVEALMRMLQLGQVVIKKLSVESFHHPGRVNTRRARKRYGPQRGPWASKYRANIGGRTPRPPGWFTTAKITAKLDDRSPRTFALFFTEPH